MRRGGNKVDGVVPSKGKRPPKSVRVSQHAITEPQPTPSLPLPILEDLNKPPEKKHKPDQAERKAARAAAKRAAPKSAAPMREKPGAALAKAQREKVGIQRSQGQKITFDT